MVQEIITYCIIGIAFLFVLWKILKSFRKKSLDSACSSGCSSCTFQESCNGAKFVKKVE
ncbi:FeoB-associated Cys-rich membrane protein [Cytophagales bacterium RKSG123]|nr:FeoB-associated Cys-rich membrane protein [Xanthovirga aplysinae]